MYGCEVAAGAWRLFLAFQTAAAACVEQGLSQRRLDGSAMSITLPAGKKWVARHTPSILSHPNQNSPRLRPCLPPPGQVLYGVNQRLRVEDVDSPLVAQRPVKSVAIVVITGDRGLCGGYNK